MRVVVASSEVAPFAKTGGLADVCGALPRELAKLDVEPLVFLPAFRQTGAAGQPIEETEFAFQIPIGGKTVAGRLLKSQLPHSDVPVYLVEQNEYYDRNEFYREAGHDYKDNCERFVFFCRAVMESLCQMGEPVDILHCNDWQTGLIPAYLKLEHAHSPVFKKARSVLTIHNMAYQGNFWHWDMLLTGLDWKHFNWLQMEFHGNLNLLKTGIVFSDAVSTVSPTYAREIQSDPLGCGLEGALRQRGDALTGIINGIDETEWDPAIDQHLPRTYSITDWPFGKRECKTTLQKELGLAEKSHVPLIGLVGRLADQKGWDLVVEVMQRWLGKNDVQWAILGTGEPHYHQLLSDLSGKHPDQLGVKLGFSHELAHRIEAAADMFLMPSLYEPCGLNQLYSLKYGTVPVVRATGGLADSIVDATPDSLADRTANGFSFHDYNADSLEESLHRACDLFRGQADTWRQLVETGMSQDWSWAQSARQYVELYRRLLP